MSHTVLDNACSPPLVRALSATWPCEAWPYWHVYPGGKRVTKDPSRLPTAAHLLLPEMVARCDGTGEWFPDLDLHAAGLAEMPIGSTLGLHLDSARHPCLPWRREASAVLYLDDCDGGELELCDAAGNTVESIQARRNRLVVFHTPGQWHRVAECRSVRKSLCLFFWSEQSCPSGATQATFR